MPASTTTRLLTAVICWALLFRPGMTAVQGAPAADRDRFVPLLPVTLGDEVWSNALEPRTGPPRDGKPTEALRWPVDVRPGPDSPPLLRDWSGVSAVRFYLHTDKPYSFKLNVLLTGAPGGYFIASVPLDFSGWHRITIPLLQFGKVRDVELSQVSRLSFRMQGYGQPPIEKGTVWWVDEIEVEPKPGVKLAMTTSLEANREAWQALAARGNPFLLLNADHFSRPLDPFRPPDKITSAWQYRSVAESLVPAAFAAADPQSPLRGRQDLVDHALAGVDWLVGECHADGWWWKSRPPEGDPNVNRFTLGPLLDTVRYLRMLPAGQAAWPRWEQKLAAAVELQRRAYEGQEAWDWGGLAGGNYANQDVYYVLIMALSAELFSRPADMELARDMMRKVAGNQLPDGGFHYIGVDNEAPVYHALNLVIIGRYATLTKDPVAIDALKRSANYWPLVLTAEGQPEFWSDVWWKQTWGYVWSESVVIAAGATGDARNQWLMWQVLAHTAPTTASMADVYCAPYWTGTQPGQAMPERFLVRDSNMRGIRGRDGQWYFGVTQGRGLRNTFVGGLVTSATHYQALQAAFRGAQIDVLQNAKQAHGLWLSQVKDRTGLALQPETAAGLGVRYDLQPGFINGVPTPETPASPWQVTQVWRASGDGLLGMVVLEAMADAPGIAVAGRIALGPREVSGHDDDWQCGPLRVKLLRKFGEVAAAPVPGYNQTRESAWQGVEMRQPLSGGAKRGDRFVYAAWIGPETAEPPSELKLLPDDAGWVATWPNGRATGCVFNATAQPLHMRLPWPGATARVWSDKLGVNPLSAARTEKSTGGMVPVEIAPGECLLLSD